MQLLHCWKDGCYPSKPQNAIRLRQCLFRILLAHCVAFGNNLGDCFYIRIARALFLKLFRYADMFFIVAYMSFPDRVISLFSQMVVWDRRHAGEPGVGAAI